MVTLLTVLRVVHIVGGVFWAGSSFVMAGFIEPTVHAAGDDGRRFMQQFSARSRFSPAVAAAAGATVLSGLWLMWIFYTQLGEVFFQTSRGLSLTLGMLFSLVAFVLGMVMINRPLRQLAKMGAAAAGSGAPPTPEQGAQMGKLAGTARLGGRLVAVLLLFAVAFMAAGRYLPS
jgi:uncharacterized membrane protein